MSVQIVSLSDIAYIQLGKAFKKAVEDIGQSGGAYLIQIGDLNNGNFDQPERLPSVEIEFDYSKFYINPDDILLPLRGNQIKGYIINNTASKPLITTNQVAVIACRSELCEPYYLAWYLNSEEFAKYIYRTNEGSNMPKLSSSQIKQMSIKLPSKKTQMDIAKVYRNWLNQRALHLELVERGDYLYQHLCKNILDERLL
jgi:restriction endonuclease S subunit